MSEQTSWMNCELHSTKFLWLKMPSHVVGQSMALPSNQGRRFIGARIWLKVRGSNCKNWENSKFSAPNSFS
jgi:hypothetical protein